MDDTLLALIALLLVIGFHEYGHYSALKKFGVVAPDFSIGFGPTLCTIHRHGTDFHLRLIPLGGFVSFPEGWQQQVTSWQQVRVLFAGPWANVVTAIPAIMLLVLEWDIGDSFLTIALVMLIAAFSTPVLFLVFIPLSLYAAIMILLGVGSALAQEPNYVDGSRGIIGILAERRPEDVSAWEHFLTSFYIFSLGVASSNMLPLSVLDGGQIWAITLRRFKRFVQLWQVLTTITLSFVIVIVYANDIKRVFGWW